ncbi:uncharacterized protein LOC126847194 [Adelges cooleyi]|uniref:uncharacterized protein LOC126847194 n=1 Tax=Adelges cooleyi TaxID=133065 RepID=UPI00217F62ED|nr:uncharacterized protein LOC126847194 [Adelges cooleyi]
MKLFCFLTTFVLVNVLANDEVTYKKVVFFTNAAIELAYNTNELIEGDNFVTNGLEYVIEKMVNDEDSYKSFAKINLMMAVPDKTDLVNHIPSLVPFFPMHMLGMQYQLFVRQEIRDTLGMEYLSPIKKCINYQNYMQQEIKDTLEIDFPEADESQDFGSLDLTILANQRRRLVKTAIKKIFRRVIGTMFDQFFLELEVRDTLNLVGSNLATLIEERRATGTSLENTIRQRVLGTENPEVVEDQNGSIRDCPLLRFCRLMGLYMSTQLPTLYIKKIWIDSNENTCTLDDGTIERKFKKINGVWSQISSTT